MSDKVNNEQVKVVCDIARTSADALDQFAAMKRSGVPWHEIITPDLIEGWAEAEASGAEIIRQLVWCVEDLWRRLEVRGQ